MPCLEMSTMTSMPDLLRTIAESQDQAQFQVQNWMGTFEEYLGIVRKDPRVTRTAYQRRAFPSRTCNSRDAATSSW